jgi:hypothetical protein
MTGEGLDAIVINTSGCGTTVKDYGHMFRNEALAAEAKAVSEIAMDVSEVLMKLDLPEGAPKGLRRLSRGLLAAAWPADQDLSQGPAEAGRASRWSEPRTATCAAARRGPTT